jgi:hypothetical protein
MAGCEGVLKQARRDGRRVGEHLAIARGRRAASADEGDRGRQRERGASVAGRRRGGACHCCLEGWGRARRRAGALLLGRLRPTYRLENWFQ